MLRFGRNIFFAMLCASLLCGCSLLKGNEEEEPQEPIKYVESKGEKKEEIEDLSGKTKITLVTGKDKTGTLSRILTDYNSKNKDVEVVLKETAEDKREQYSYLTSALDTGESSYDILYIDSGWSMEFAQKGYIENLTNYIEASDINLEEYLPNSLTPSRYNGSLFSLPITVSMDMIFFRQDILDAAPTSWREIMMLAENQQGSYDTISGFVFGTRGGFDLSATTMSLMRGYGGYLFDENGVFAPSETGVKEGIQELYNIYNGKGTPKNVYLFNRYDAGTEFFKGNTILMINEAQEWSRGTSSSSKIAGKFATSPLPRSGENNPDVLWCTSMAICANSSNKDKAWDVIQFLLSSESQKNFALYGGFVPAMTKSLDDNDVLRANPYFKSTNFKTSIMAARPQPANPNYATLLQLIDDKLVDYLTNVTDLNTTVELIKNALQPAN